MHGQLQCRIRVSSGQYISDDHRVCRRDVQHRYRSRVHAVPRWYVWQLDDPDHCSMQWRVRCWAVRLPWPDKLDVQRAL